MPPCPGQGTDHQLAISLLRGMVQQHFTNGSDNLSTKSPWNGRIGRVYQQLCLPQSFRLPDRDLAFGRKFRQDRRNGRLCRFLPPMLHGPPNPLRVCRGGGSDDAALDRIAPPHRLYSPDDRLVSATRIPEEAPSVATNAPSNRGRNRVPHLWGHPNRAWNILRRMIVRGSEEKCVDR